MQAGYYCTAQLFVLTEDANSNSSLDAQQAFVTTITGATYTTASGALSYESNFRVRRVELSLLLQVQMASAHGP